ncbi:MAG TPA: hypothetical protein VEB42_02730, partial [Chitinophagaceae bacterium]|nr:hypothetical protein [Chitinophagaceae bacterium]
RFVQKSRDFRDCARCCWKSWRASATIPVKITKRIAVPVDADAVLFSNPFQKLTGDPYLVASLFGTFGKNLELPLTRCHFGIDAFHIQAGIQTGIKVFLQHRAAVGIIGADITIVDTAG